jgi:hypothetical protein
MFDIFNARCMISIKFFYVLLIRFFNFNKIIIEYLVRQYNQVGLSSEDWLEVPLDSWQCLRTYREGAVALQYCTFQYAETIDAPVC